MHIAELLRGYGSQRDVGATTLKWLSLILSRFERFLGRPPSLDDFRDDIVNDWTAAMLAASQLSRATVHGYRRGLLILWRFAVEQGLVERMPAHIRRLKVPAPAPVAWTLDEVAALANAASNLPGFHRTGADRSRVLHALVMVAWDSGLRLTDLLRLKFSDIGTTGNGVIVQHKTGNPVIFRLSGAAMSALEEIRLPKRTFIFGEVASRKAIFMAMREAALSAGLAGGTRKIRKSGATAVEAANPGAAMAYLGHKTPGLAYKHYVDPRLVQQQKPNPPPLAG